MAEKQLPGTVPPQEIITDLGDKRLFEITFAGAFNNQLGAIKHLIDKGLIKPEKAEPGKPALSYFDLGGPLLKKVMENPSLNPEIKSERDKWYVDLYMEGFKRVFGFKAANRKSELRAVRTDFESNPIPVPFYSGELPALLNDDATVEALQRRLDIQYGEHGVLMGPPPVIMALYEDIAVSIRPSSRTLIQGKTEIWQLEARTNLRGPGEARMAA